MPTPKFNPNAPYTAVQFDPNAEYSSAAEETPSAKDFTAGPSNTEGTYKMAGPDGKVVDVPYSKVGAASQAKYRMLPDFIRKYVRDAAADTNLGQGMNLPPGVKVVGRNSAGQPIFGSVDPREQKTGAVGRLLSSFGGALGGGIKGMYHGIVDSAQTPEEIAVENTYPGGPLASRAAMLAHRMVVNPAIEQGKQAVSEFKAANAETPWTSMKPSPAAVEHREQALAHGLAAVTPFVGPWAAQVGEQAGTQIGTGDVAGGVGTLAGNVVMYGAPHLVGKVGRAALRAAPEAVRGAAQTMLGGGERQVGREVKSTIKTANQAALDEIERAGNERLKTLEKHRADVKDYEQQHQKIKEENEQSYRREQQRQKLEAEEQSVSRELEKKYQGAFAKAKAAYNSAWNQWREMVKDVKVDMSPAVQAIKATESGMNPTQVSEFRDILRETKPDPVDLSEIQRTRDDIVRSNHMGTDYASLSDSGKKAVDTIIERLNLSDVEEGLTTKEVPASRLHGWKSQLEVAVRSTKDGTVRFAIGKVLDQVRKLEEEASATAGADKQLKQARALTGPYFDAFFKSPTEMPRALAQSFREQTPEFVKEKAQQERLARIAAYDPSISSLAKHLENVQKGLREIPKPKEFKQLPTAPVRPPLPKAEVEVPNLDTRAMREKLIDAKVADWTNVSKWQVARLITGPLGAIVAAISGHPLYSAAGAVYSAAELTPFMIARVLDKPGVREWITRPPAEELATLRQIPNADRVRIVDGLKAVVQTAEKQGKPIHVAPALASLMAAGAGQQGQQTLKELRERAQQQQPGFVLKPTTETPGGGTPAAGSEGQATQPLAAAPAQAPAGGEISDEDFLLKVK